MKGSLTSAALLSLLPHLASAQVAILRIQVVEGADAVYASGTRITRPLAVVVTDETGKPVEGVSVSFHVPDEGPGGSFGNGLRTDVASTDAVGRAAPHALLVNHTPGRYQIRVIAAKEQARAGMIVSQYVAELNSPAAKSSSRGNPAAARHKFKWIVVAALVGGGAAVGAMAAGRGNSSVQTSSTPSATPVSIGGPTITVGKP